MKLISKFLALALFAASAATISYAAPSSAQAERAVPYPQPDNQCCTPATRVIATGQPGWTVTNVNSNVFHPAVTLAGPLPSVWATLPGSSWIGPHQGAGQSAKLGTYIYEYHFCLCDVPAGMKFPASLSLRIYADDEVKVTLNNSPVLAQKLGGWAFTSSSPPAPAGLQSPPGGTQLNVSSSYFQRCDNVLRFQVVNGVQSSPTGLDVYGTISAYFRQPTPGTKCCAGPPPHGEQ